MTHPSEKGAGGGNGPRSLSERDAAAIDVRMPSDVRLIEHVIGLVRQQCQAHDCAVRHCSLNIPVALAEALSNAILRGNREDPRKYVTVRSRVAPDRVVLEVADEGAGFDLERSVSDPTRPENLLREDGRGLYLITRLMDRVERFTADGNVVRMTLNRNPRAP